MNWMQKLLLLIPALQVIYTMNVSSSDTASGNGLPIIFGEIDNITAAVGKTAKFTCTVKNLNKYHVVWFHVERNMLLTIHSKVVTRIPRFSVLREDEERWSLQIRDILKEDKGAYACQVNTEPQLRKMGYLDVVVPPEIIDMRSSASSVVVKENGNVTLTCHAEGNPPPKISWVREDHGPITITQRKKVYQHKGPDLELRKVSRTDMGAYLCIASNGFPPTVSKRTVLYVEFSPIVIVPNQLMSAPLGTSVSLECVTEAYPRSVTFWRYNNNMVMSTNKYRLQEFHENYRTRVLLTINQLTKDDYGVYMCNSRNSFGENGGSVELHELIIPESDKHRGSKKTDIDNGYDGGIVDNGESRSSDSYVHNQVVVDMSGSKRQQQLSNDSKSSPTSNDTFDRKHTNLQSLDRNNDHRSTNSILANFFPETSLGHRRKSDWFMVSAVTISFVYLR